MHTTPPSFGIATAPQQVSYDDLLRVWQEADTLPQIEHAWAFDHLLPIGGDPDGPIFEGWTLLSALAAQTTRLRLGLMVTSNRVRPPALLAKIAATVDIVSRGRLEFGIGAGSRTDIPWARREYDAYGLPYHDAAYAVGSLAEACTVIRRLWTEDKPFDFHGRYYDLIGAFCNPKPVQRPGPPIVMGGQATATLRAVAEHADVWNFPGGDVEAGVRRGAVLDRFCAEIGRDPASITRSLVLPVSYDEPGRTRDVIARGVGAGFRHFVLSLPAPYPENVARWVADEVISRSRLSRQGAPAGRFADGADAATGPGPVGRSVHACSEVIRAVADTHPTGQPKSGPERTRGSAHSRRAAAAAVKRRISGRNRTASRQAIDWKRPRHRRGAATQSRGAVPDAE